MLWLLIYLFCVMTALGMGLLAGWSDFRGLKIPNLIHVVIAAAFFVAFAAVHLSGHFKTVTLFAPLWRHAVAALVILGITFVLFTLRLMGGGDAKLLSAYTLWSGFGGLPPLLFYMAVTGAVMGITTIAIRNRKPFKAPREGSWIARAQAGENRVPYGIPIALGAFAAFFLQGYISPDKLRLFLTAGAS